METKIQIEIDPVDLKEIIRLLRDAGTIYTVSTAEFPRCLKIGKRDLLLLAMDLESQLATNS